MRLIDADELLKQPLDTANYPSNYVRNAPTVQSVPIEILEELKAEIRGPKEATMFHAQILTVDDICGLIDRKIREVSE